MIANPCGVHYQPCLFDEAKGALGNVTLRQFSSWDNPLQSLFAMADGACLHPNASYVPGARRACIGSNRPNDYRAAWDAAVDDLRALNALPNAVGIAVESIPAHFEEPPTRHSASFGMRSVDYVGEPGSYQRMWLASLMWLHPLLQTPEADDLLCLMGLSWDQRLGSTAGMNFAGEVILQASRLDAATCSSSAAGTIDGATRSSGLCLKRALTSLAHPTSGCASVAAPLQAYKTTGKPNACMAGVFNYSFRASIEAHTPGVPTIRRRQYRAERFDAHPYRDTSMTGPLDCMHSSFARGAFDGEIVDLLELLERRKLELPTTDTSV